MIRITPAQAQALDDRLDDAAQIAVWLPRDYPEPFAELDSRQRRGMARCACRRAEAWGAKTRKEKFAFTGLMAAIAPDFDRHPLVQAALTQKRAKQPILSLAQTVPSEAWDAMKATACSIGWRLEAPIWSTPPDQRVGIAVAQCLDSGAPKSVRSVGEAVALAREAGRPYAPAGEPALFILSLWSCLTNDPQTVFDEALAQAPNLPEAVLRLGQGLLTEHGVWA